MENVAKGPAHQAYLLLKTAFVLIPIIAGLDKFFHLLVDWNQFIIPQLGTMGPKLMMVAGVVEVIAGLGVLFKPKVFSYIVALWLSWIIANLYLLGAYYDIALRDFGLCLSAFALARLAKLY
jgi:uncharacterized membrane protein HdeD (DUF308 family)